MEKDKLVQIVAHWFQGMARNEDWDTLSDLQAQALASDLIDYIGDWYAEKTTSPTIVTNLIQISMNLFLTCTSAWILYYNNLIRGFFHVDL